MCSGLTHLSAFYRSSGGRLVVTALLNGSSVCSAPALASHSVLKANVDDFHTIAPVHVDPVHPVSCC